jgi:hypothetical protein
VLIIHAFNHVLVSRESHWASGQMPYGRRIAAEGNRGKMNHFIRLNGSLLLLYASRDSQMAQIGGRSERKPERFPLL